MNNSHDEIAFIREETLLDSIEEHNSSDVDGMPNEPLNFKDGGVDIEDVECNDSKIGPSFLKRVSAPLGEDLLVLLNTPAKSVSSDNVQNSDVVKSLFSPNDMSVVSGPRIAVSDSISTAAMTTALSPKMMPTPLAEDDKIRPTLYKTTSMDSNYGNSGKERSGSFVPSVAMRCGGCDACRGRVCRPRLAGDFVTVMTPLRYIPTVFPPNTVQGRQAAVLSPLIVGAACHSPMAAASSQSSAPRAQVSGSLDGLHPAVSGEKSKAVFWHENLKYAIPFRRTIRLLTMLSSNVCPRVSTFVKP